MIKKKIVLLQTEQLSQTIKKNLTKFKNTDKIQPN